MTELKDLSGIHTLTGVDRYNAEISYRHNEMSDHISFCLDSIVYTAMEDPDDGYRSTMRELIETPEYVMQNTFQPHSVEGIYITSYGHHNSCEILSIVDTVTGKEVLRVGTDNTDDYYPYFVAEWMPENLSANASKS